MSSKIEFSLAARQKLEERLAAVPYQLEAKRADIRHRLGIIFPDAAAQMVQDVYQGYRIHPDEYVLLVELMNSGSHDGRYVVKLGKSIELEKEYGAWCRCQPAGLRHDLVLMPIQPRWQDGRLVGLVYDDAQQFIGVDETLQLEAAMLECVRTGSPTIESVADVLFQLYERLGIVMYRYSHQWEPPKSEELKLDAGRKEPLPKETPEERAERVSKVADALKLGQHLLTNLERWEPPREAVRDTDHLRWCQLAFEVRRDAQRFADDAVGTRYRDACSVFRAILTHIANGGKPADFVPFILRGRAHGDLHGRNVLVGRILGRILWPAVYDHEHMSLANIVAMDFVKLEFEFKIRAYDELFSGEAKDSVPKILDFEHEVFDETESCRRAGRWPDRLPTGAGHRERLKWLILKIREAAGRQLGARGRGGKWLTEYYFLLALYGLNGIRFGNLEAHQLLAGYTAAGAAAARFAYGWGQPTGSEIASPHANPLSYHAELKQAREWRMMNKPDEAMLALTVLKSEHAYAIDIRHEMVYVLEKRDLDEAIREFQQLETMFPDLDDESLCRGGKIHKRLADKEINLGVLGSALNELKKAAVYYRRAFALRRWFYPGVNELSVRLLQAQLLAELEAKDPKRERQAANILNAVRRDAETLIDDEHVWVARDSNDRIWMPASKGEVALLAGNEKVAERAYAQAKHAAGNTVEHFCGTMCDQLEKLVPALDKLGIPVEGPLRDPRKFFGIK